MNHYGNSFLRKRVPFYVNCIFRKKIRIIYCLNAMPLLSHKFRDHIISSKTEILIIGTFNPDIPEGPDFFYGRPRNFLWQLLPQAFGIPSLKYATLKAKKDFMRDYRVDFADLISSVNAEAGQEQNVADVYIDSRVQSWTRIKLIIDQLPDLSSVFFTRKSFGGVPNIKRQIFEIEEYVRDRNLYFACLETPARYPGVAKQKFWVSKLIDREA